MRKEITSQTNNIHRQRHRLHPHIRTEPGPTEKQHIERIMKLTDGKKENKRGKQKKRFLEDTRTVNVERMEGIKSVDYNDVRPNEKPTMKT